MNSMLRIYLTKKDAKDFSIWAFGDDERLVTHLDRLHAWNRAHGEVLRLYPHGYLYEDIPRMIELWRSTREDT